jgi:glycerol-3-phosphate acyltransferase PlsX
MGAYLLKPSLRRFKRRLDYTEVGGAPLLGVNGVVFIGHGRSNAKAVMNGIRLSADLVRQGINDVIRQELERVSGGKVATS